MLTLLRPLPAWVSIIAISFDWQTVLYYPVELSAQLMALGSRVVVRLSVWLLRNCSLKHGTADRTAPREIVTILASLSVEVKPAQATRQLLD